MERETDYNLQHCGEQGGGSRDVLLLDIALESWFRTLLERQVRGAFWLAIASPGVGDAASLPICFTVPAFVVLEYFEVCQLRNKT